MEIEQVKNATPRHNDMARRPGGKLREYACQSGVLKGCGSDRHDVLLRLDRREESIPYMVWSHVD
jgi:hypothetical protein